MSTNEFARILLTWIKSFLSWIGIPRDRLNELDEIIFLILIVVIAFAVGAVFHYLSVRFTRKVLKYKNISFLSSLIEYIRIKRFNLEREKAYATGTDAIHCCLIPLAGYYFFSVSPPFGLHGSGKIEPVKKSC